MVTGCLSLVQETLVAGEPVEVQVSVKGDEDSALRDSIVGGAVINYCHIYL